MRRSVEGDGIEVGDAADLMRALGSGVPAGHGIAAWVAAMASGLCQLTATEVTFER